MVSFADQAFIKSVVTNFDIAAAALLVYDYLITVGDEITYMWPSAWNPGKVLFFLTRYLVFVDTSLVLVHQFQVLTPNQCGIIFRSIGWMLGIGVGIAEAILTMRTCVIWAGNKTVQYALITIFIVLWAPLLYFLNDALSSLVFTTPPNPGTPGCFLLTQKNILFAVFIIVMSYETIIMTLTVIKGVTHFRQASSPLVVVLYRDGILNYIWLFGTCSSSSLG
ncbi:hypothetical protein SISSUDRAFT_365799 [Sistotremastrum suecicum HHB10207 ss-3]|uniref:DUF6533 domain-containing protein n=1 Tax=Sistotremastrum suecicum HHB10207 ss-3 TaxID=1314776 RepID=A0A165Z417_9AGAM|nr:hypothetical protein SISSUDRAFT_365799 [Sistotremastrum suecicum HHB10207 ss-3]